MCFDLSVSGFVFLGFGLESKRESRLVLSLELILESKQALNNKPSAAMPIRARFFRFGIFRFHALLAFFGFFRFCIVVFPVSFVVVITKGQPPTNPFLAPLQSFQKIVFWPA